VEVIAGRTFSSVRRRTVAIDDRLTFLGFQSLCSRCQGVLLRPVFASASFTCCFTEISAFVDQSTELEFDSVVAGSNEVKLISY
jgi:hypothetical protein